ncbi:MAG: hypothetical protein JNN15_20180, partial [Blastocatellia bacterium]|nr:hypothetical protein [Blastocatellia bacterium]
LGQSLIKQKVFAELVEAEYIEIAGKQATKVVGDTPTRERNFIILLANNGYLYKWTLYGLRPNDAEPVASLQQLLSSVTIKGK